MTAVGLLLQCEQCVLLLLGKYADQARSDPGMHGDMHRMLH